MNENKKLPCRTFPTPVNATEPSSIADLIRGHRGLLTVDQLSELLSASPKSLYAWVKQGRLPAVRLGASVKFDPFITAQWFKRSSPLKSAGSTLLGGVDLLLCSRFVRR